MSRASTRRSKDSQSNRRPREGAVPVTVLESLAPTFVGLAVLVAVTTLVLSVAGVPHRFAPALAILRGAVQLAFVSVVLSGVITNRLWVLLALLVMFVVAATTSTLRIGRDRRSAAVVAGSMLAGVLAALVIVFVTGAIDFSARYLLAIGGIVVGNSMSIATLAGRRFFESVDEHWEVVEGWFALGATPRQSTWALGRRSISAALVPSVDQTKTTGLVTLPGAFVGAVFGGVSPLEAGRFQVVVLGAIMAAGAITAVLLITALSAVRRRPSPTG
jgi:putative ABC transport system permease protein